MVPVYTGEDVPARESGRRTPSSAGRLHPLEEVGDNSAERLGLFRVWQMRAVLEDV
jgi:hypothetical protein